MIPPALHSFGWSTHILKNAHLKVREDPSTANPAALFGSLSSTLAHHDGAKLQDPWVSYL